MIRNVDGVLVSFSRWCSANPPWDLRVVFLLAHVLVKHVSVVR